MTIQMIAKKINPILKEQGVTKAAVFGSFARGENKKKSDVDLLIKFPKNKTLFDFIGLKQDLEKRLGKKVDLVEYSAIKPRLKKPILKNRVEIL